MPSGPSVRLWLVCRLQFGSARKATTRRGRQMKVWDGTTHAQFCRCRPGCRDVECCGAEPCQASLLSVLQWRPAPALKALDLPCADKLSLSRDSSNRVRKSPSACGSPSSRLRRKPCSGHSPFCRTVGSDFRGQGIPPPQAQKDGSYCRSAAPKRFLPLRCHAALAVRWTGFGQAGNHLCPRESDVPATSRLPPDLAPTNSSDRRSVHALDRTLRPVC